jgi:predicted transcriptional regulator
MVASVTIRLDDELERALEQAVRVTGRTRSDLIREALHRHLGVMTLNGLRERMTPFAAARGWLTDEDVFNEVS